MRKVLLLALVFGVVMAQWGWGVALGQEIPSIIDHAMAIDVDTETYEPIGITYSFTVDAEGAISWVNFGPVYDSHEVLWEWYSPDNELHFTWSEMLEDPGEDYYWEEYPIWNWMDIAGYEASQMPGEWRVDIYLDEILVLTENFTISDVVGRTERPPYDGSCLPCSSCACPTRLDVYDPSTSRRVVETLRLLSLVEPRGLNCWPVDEPNLITAEGLWQEMQREGRPDEQIQLLTLFGQSQLGNVCFVIDGPDDRIVIGARVWAEDSDPSIIHMTLGSKAPGYPNALWSILDESLTDILGFLCYEFEVVRIRAMIDCYCKIGGGKSYEQWPLDSAGASPYEEIRFMMDEVDQETQFYTNKANQTEAYTLFMQKVRAFERGLPFNYFASWLFEKILAYGGDDKNSNCDIALDYPGKDEYIDPGLADIFEVDIDAHRLGEANCCCLPCWLQLLWE